VMLCHTPHTFLPSSLFSSCPKLAYGPFQGPALWCCVTLLLFGYSLIGGDGFLLSQNQPMGTELQFLPNPGSKHIPVFRLTGHSTCHLLARWFAGLFFDPKDGGAMFLRNVGCYTTDYTASYPRRCYSSLWNSVASWRKYKKFLEELIASFPFTVNWVSDMTSRKKTLICMRNEVNKTIQFGRLQCWYYWWEWFMKYTVQMASG
jgi:hypothetical protein